MWIAVHEIGHALGMLRHSPIPADVMYEVVRDRVRVPGPSIEDVNSFVNLYQLPNGTVLGRMPSSEDALAAGSAGAPEGPPRLVGAPYVDPRLGFRFRPPSGWMQLETGRGVAVFDGVSWDYAASFQIVVERFDTLEEYLERFGDAYLARGQLRNVDALIIRGKRALHAILETRDGSMLEEVTLIESGDGRVLVMIADCPIEYEKQYRPWFNATRSTVAIWDDVR